MPCEWVSASRSIEGTPVTTRPVLHCHTPEDVNTQIPLQEPQILHFVQYNPCQTQIQIYFSQNKSFVRLILVFLSPSRQMTGSVLISAWPLPSQPFPVHLLSVSLIFTATLSELCGPGSSVGIATGYGLDGPGMARFFVHVQTGPGSLPASCTMGTGSFPGVKRPERGADHPPPPSTKVKNE
jgi:hypothetical protein